MANTYKRINRGLIAFILAAALAITLFPQLFSFSAKADDTGTVFVHFYNGDNQYEYDEYVGQENVVWGAYFWFDYATTVAPTAGVTGGFENPNAPENEGRLYELTLSAREVAYAKQGREMGLIMVRCTQEGGKIAPYWNHKDIPTDRKIRLSLDANNTQHLYIIAGDKTNYLTYEHAKSAFERIESAQFDTYSKVLFQTTSQLTAQTDISIIKRTYVDGQPVDETLNQDPLHVNSNDITYPLNYPIEEKHKRRASINLSAIINQDNFDFRADYLISIAGYAYPTSIEKTRLFLSDHFINNFTPKGDATKTPKIDSINFGASVVGSGANVKTEFYLWAPISGKVILKTYASGDALIPTPYMTPISMEYLGRGVYHASVDANLHGVYYTYTLTNYSQDTETIDPYAVSAGVNGDRAMVVDFSKTNPDGWDNDLAFAKDMRDDTYTDPNPVIWEVHVRDFSVHPDSGITYKGKYLAFTEDNTTLKGDSSVKTGISYLKDLGVNYVHLLPTSDFSSVDESRIGDPAYDGKFNWGYDPKNYNVPEGSYSTDPFNGEVRVMEYKRMVKALHDAGIGVIMDMVYNHTYTMDSCFDRVVPGYYYRQSNRNASGGHNTLGSFSAPSWNYNSLGMYEYSDASGCGSETASEREMFRKYMVDSVDFWAEEYHIDGFRFDLMAAHDVTTMNKIREKVDNNADLGNAHKGKGILLYGEPWAAAWDGLYGVAPANNSNYALLDNRIAGFSDEVRGGIKGGNGIYTDPDTGYEYLETGYLNGNLGDHTFSRLTAGVQGATNGVRTPTQLVTYTTSHDNYTLWDHLLTSFANGAANSMRTSAYYHSGNDAARRAQKVGASLVLLSRGIAFLGSGDEFARTKYGNHNSYSSQDKVNMLDYGRVREFGDIYNHYKALIALRKSYKAFNPARMGKNAADARAEYPNYDMYVYVENNCISVNIRGIGGDYTDMLIVYNGTGSSQSINARSWNSVSNWGIICNQNGFNYDGSTFGVYDNNFSTTTAVSGAYSASLNVPAYSTFVFVK